MKAIKVNIHQLIAANVIAAIFFAAYKVAHDPWEYCWLTLVLLTVSCIVWAHRGEIGKKSGK